MTTNNCLKDLKKCPRCGDCAVEEFDYHSICYSCNNLRHDENSEEIQDWAFQEDVSVKREHDLFNDGDDL